MRGSIQVVKIELDNESCPIDTWLTSLRDKATRARLYQRIDKLERGSFGDHKSVGSGVSELRVFFGPGYRIYYGMIGAIVVVLLGGGDKSNQSSDIKNAQVIWETFNQAGQPVTALKAWREAEANGNEEDKNDETSKL